jgi:hypothetical protein
MNDDDRNKEIARGLFNEALQEPIDILPAWLVSTASERPGTTAIIRLYLADVLEDDAANRDFRNEDDAASFAVRQQYAGHMRYLAALYDEGRLP